MGSNDKLPQWIEGPPLKDLLADPWVVLMRCALLYSSQRGSTPAR
jgi:hypothetical protein